VAKSYDNANAISATVGSGPLDPALGLTCLVTTHSVLVTEAVTEPSTPSIVSVGWHLRALSAQTGYIVSCPPRILPTLDRCSNQDSKPVPSVFRASVVSIWLQRRTAQCSMFIGSMLGWVMHLISTFTPGRDCVEKLGDGRKYVRRFMHI